MASSTMRQDTTKKGPVESSGAYAATPEPVGAAFIVEAVDMDDAVRLASLHPGANLSEFFGSGAIECARSTTSSCARPSRHER